MANLQPVIPTVIGRPQTARKNVHMVNMPNPLADLGRNISGLANPLGNLGLGVALIQQERDRADYKRTLNEALGEVNRRMNSEVFSQEGFSAEGSLERTGRIFKEVRDKYAAQVKGMNPRNRQLFEEDWGSYYNNQQNQAMRHEHGHLTRAQVGANNEMIQRGTELYVASGDVSMMAMASQAHDDNWRIQHGGYLVNHASVEAFKRDIEDEDGKVTMRDGTKLDIVEEAEPGTPGVITKDQARSILKNMEKQADAYEQSRMGMWDTAHAKIIDNYLSQDKVSDADKYLASVDERGLISKDAKKAAEEAIGRKRDVVEISTETTKLLDELQAKAGGDSIAYGSELQDRLFTETMRDIDRQYTGEKYKMGQQIKHQLAEKYRLLQDAQKARAAQDTVSTMKQMQDAKMDLPQMHNTILSMKDSPVKAALLKAYDRQEAAAKAEQAEYDNNTDPAFLLKQEDSLTWFKLALANGGAELDGIRYDFNVQDQVIACVKNLGLTSKNRKRAADYIADSRKSVDAMQAGTELAKQIGVDTAAEALREYPWILADLDEIKGSAVIEQEKMGQWLKTNISALLAQEATQHRTFWFNRDSTVGDLASDGIDPSDVFMDTEQLAKRYQTLRAQRALNRGDMAGAAKAFDEKPGAKELSDFAAKRGMVLKKGNYYFTGGK